MSMFDPPPVEGHPWDSPLAPLHEFGTPPDAPSAEVDPRDYENYQDYQDALAQAHYERGLRQAAIAETQKGRAAKSEAASLLLLFC